jgi:type I restriction enzyme S subunit
MKWQRIVFSQLYLEPSRNGIYKSQENHGTGIKIINMGELFGYDFIADQPMKRISMTDSEIDRFCLQNGDLLFGRRSLVESGAGKCSLIDNLIEKTTFESSIIRVRLDPNLALPKFYYYWFKSLRGSGAIRAIVTGTNVKGIKGSDLKNITVDYPSIITQQKIADILSKYDDLIENNRRRIELLERSARLLYKEWFVRLRFPGHEHTPIIDGIPEGWERLKLGEVLTLQRGFDLPSAKRTHGQYPIFASTGINGYHEKAKVQAPGIVTGRSGSLGKVMYIAEDFWPLNTTLYVKDFIKVDAVFALHLLENLHLEQYNAGAAVPTLNRNDIHKIKVLCPSCTLKSLFLAFANPIYTQIHFLDRYNQKLKQARDILLPKLMNGEIEV